MLAASIAAASGAGLVVLPPHIKARKADDELVSLNEARNRLITYANSFEPQKATDYDGLRKTRKERSSPNEPFYRKLKRERW
jgi:hypothetical protein